MKMKRCVPVLLLACLLLPVHAEETATFRYAPPAKLLTVTTVTTTHLIEDKVASTEVSETKERTVAARTAAGGYTEMTTLIAATKQTDGEIDTADADDRCVLDIGVTVETTAQGKLVAISGLDAVAANAKTVLDAHEQAAIGPMFTEKALRAAATDNWQSGVGCFIGRTVKEGDHWTAVGYYPLPNGAGAKTLTTYTVTGFTTVKDRRCVRVQAVTVVDRKAMAAAFAAFFKRLPRPEGMPAPVATLTRQELTHELELDPETLQCLSRRGSETVAFTLTLKGMGSIHCEDRVVSYAHVEPDTLWRANLQAT